MLNNYFAAETFYAAQLKTSRAISNHLPALRALVGTNVATALELGTGRGASTIAFALGGVEALDSIDIKAPTRLDKITQMVESLGVLFNFNKMDVRDLDLRDHVYDLIFIDDDHSYEQVQWELTVFPQHARKYLALHDTHSARHYGVRRALKEWRQTDAGKQWKVALDILTNHGLTIFERKV